MKIISAALVVGCLGMLSAFGQDEVPPPFDRIESQTVTEETDGHDPFDPETYAPKQVRAQLEYIDLSQKDLTRLMMLEKSTRTDATGLRMKVQEMVDKDTAKVIDTQMVVSRSGQKSTTQSQKEFLYPTEYESIDNIPSAEGEKEVKEIPRPVGADFNAALPTSFESRNVGSSFEVEPTISENDKIIDIRILSQNIWHTGNAIWHETKSPEKNAYKIVTPDFYLVSIDTAVTTIKGQYVLVGILSPKAANGQADPDRKVMAFLKCDVLSAVP